MRRTGTGSYLETTIKPAWRMRRIASYGTEIGQSWRIVAHCGQLRRIMAHCVARVRGGVAHRFIVCWLQLKRRKPQQAPVLPGTAALRHPCAFRCNRDLAEARYSRSIFLSPRRRRADPTPQRRQVGSRVAQARNQRIAPQSEGVVAKNRRPNLSPLSGHSADENSRNESGSALRAAHGSFTMTDGRQPAAKARRRRLAAIAFADANRGSA